MKISVIGTGYVGLVTGTCFAETGNTVTCVDIDKSKIKLLNKGHMPIHEPGLKELFKRNIEENRLFFSTDLSSAVKKSDIIFLALPTPPKENGSADLSYILGVAKELGSILDKYTIVVTKSTVPVGTAEKVKEAIAEFSTSEFDVVSNPEFLREGFAVEDFMKPDRVVVGTSSIKAKNILNKLYAPYVRQGNPIFFMDERSSEMTKYAANSFLATKISFMNEIANLCQLTGADVDSVRFGIGADDRIGKRFLFPGIGYGGSCFPKDVLALKNTANEFGYDFRILDAVSSVNNLQKHTLFNRIMEYYEGEVKGRKFALWGLAFKPDTDDIREAPSISIIDDLIGAGASILAFDPVAAENINKRYHGNPLVQTIKHEYEALNDADALIIVTEWANFRSPEFDKIRTKLKEPVIFDGRNLYNLEDMRKLDFYYESIGRQTIKRKK